MTSSDGYVEFSRVVRPLEFRLPASEKETLSHSTDRLLTDILHTDKTNFTETVQSVTPIELTATPDLAPHYVFRALNLKAYDRAMIKLVREHSEGEVSLSHASVFLYCSNQPVIIGSELHILSDESSAQVAIDTDDPQFYLETPNDSFTGKDIIPLDYPTLSSLLYGFVEQSNIIAAIEKSDMSIDESLSAILEMAEKTSVERSTTYRFNDESMRQLGHATVAIARHVHLLSDGTAPQLIQSKIAVENTHILEGNAGEMSSTYVFTQNRQRQMARVGVAYTRRFHEASDDAEQFEQSVNTTTDQWYDRLVTEELSAHDTPQLSPTAKGSRFSSYILTGLSRMANTKGERIFTA